MVNKDSEALREIARTLKEISTHQAKQTRILETLNHNLVELFRKPSNTMESTPAKEPVEEPTPPKIVPTIYGWSMAALAQREGTLKMGDIKMEDDESRWVWTGDTWNRLEAPSDREA